MYNVTEGSIMGVNYEINCVNTEFKCLFSSEKHSFPTRWLSSHKFAVTLYN